MAQNPTPKPFAFVFENIDTSNEGEVAQAVADYLSTSRDQLTDDQLQELYNEMWSYGVPKVVSAPPLNGYPSPTG